MDIRTRALEAHAAWRGKIQIAARADASSKEALTLAYTPGVAEPCREIARDPKLADLYTRKWNTVAVVTDGSAVLGLGDIGPKAALPVMEGKCVLFRQFGGVDAIPVCLDTQDVDEIVRTVQLIAPGLGGINLEDIAAPRCFEIEEKLTELLDIPVFHDDQHGTAVTVLAALTNACRALSRKMEEQRVVLCGAGAAGIAIANMLLSAGISDVTLVDREGILTKEGGCLNAAMEKMAARTNPRGLCGGLTDALTEADVFIGVSGPGVLKGEMVRVMRKDPIIFAMANPTPEILPDEALAAGAAVVGTGRSDFPNQINNVLCFPGLFRGALDVGAKRITQEMKRAAAAAIAALVENPSRDRILPDAFDPALGTSVAEAVAKASKKAE